jgi:molecular chaperone DnaK
MDNNSADFEQHVDELRGKNFAILWRQDWFVVDRFRWLADASYLFPDRVQHKELVTAGQEAVNADDVDQLRQIVSQLYSMRIGTGSESDMLAVTNIVRS